MSKQKEFIEKLEDFELASFYKFRFQSFMDGSKRITLAELERRKINVDDIEKYLPAKNEIDKQKLESLEICPRCYSNELYIANEKESVTFKYATLDYNVDYKTCLVCLYSQDKEDHKKEKKGLWNIFSMLRFMINRKR